jgi:hypothetical protein
VTRQFTRDRVRSVRHRVAARPGRRRPGDSVATLRGSAGEPRTSGVPPGPSDWRRAEGGDIMDAEASDSA